MITEYDKVRYYVLITFDMKKGPKPSNEWVYEIFSS